MECYKCRREAVILGVVIESADDPAPEAFAFCEEHCLDWARYLVAQADKRR